MKTGWCLDGHCPGCRFPNECACLCHPETTEDLSAQNGTIEGQKKTGQAVRKHRDPGPHRSAKEID